MTAFGIVVVRDERNVDTDFAENVETIEPPRVFADFIDFINRQSESTKCQCGRRCKSHDAAVTKFFVE